MATKSSVPQITVNAITVQDGDDVMGASGIQVDDIKFEDAPTPAAHHHDHRRCECHHH